MGEKYRERKRAEGFLFTIGWEGAVRTEPHCSVVCTLPVTLYFLCCCLQSNTESSQHHQTYLTRYLTVYVTEKQGTAGVHWSTQTSTLYGERAVGEK